MNEGNKEILEETMDEIKSSLEDPRGIVKHQRRLAFSLSSGIVALLEIYLNNLKVLKPGAKINHLWLKKKKENVFKLLSKHIITPIKNITNIDKFLDIAYLIEKDRNVLAYGKSAFEKTLKSKIDLFLELKKEVENV